MLPTAYARRRRCMRWSFCIWEERLLGSYDRAAKERDHLVAATDRHAVIRQRDSSRSLLAPIAVSTSPTDIRLRIGDRVLDASPSRGRACCTRTPTRCPPARTSRRRDRRRTRSPCRAHDHAARSTHAVAHATISIPSHWLNASLRHHRARRRARRAPARHALSWTHPKKPPLRRAPCVAATDSGDIDLHRTRSATLECAASTVRRPDLIRPGEQSLGVIYPLRHREIDVFAATRPA